MKVLNDLQWDKRDLILSFTAPLYVMLRACDTNKPCLHHVYDMWDLMNENVKRIIHKHKGFELDDSCPLYDAVYEILLNHWTKNITPLHYVAHSLNSRYYSQEWLQGGIGIFRNAPHRDKEAVKERIEYLKKYFPDMTVRRVVIHEFADYSSMSKGVTNYNSIDQRYEIDPKSWWVTYCTSAPALQEEHLNTSKKIQRCRILEETTLVHLRMLEIAQLSLDEPNLESVVFIEDANEEEAEDIEEEDEM